MAGTTLDWWLTTSRFTTLALDVPVVALVLKYLVLDKT